MPLLALPLLLSALVASPLEPGVEYRLEGRVQRTDKDEDPAEKRFQMSCFTDQAGDAKKQTVYWVLTENGRGQAPWLERFGSCDAFAEGDNAASLYYLRDEGLSITDLPPFAVAADKPLSLGATWSRGVRVFEVVAESKVDGAACWKIESRDPVGRRRDMQVRKDSGLVVSLEQTFFLGRGERYQLQWRMKQTPGPANIDAAVKTVNALIAARKESGWRRLSESPTLTVTQREKLAAALPEIQKLAGDSAAKPLLNAARRDLLSQSERADSIASISKRAIGKNLVQSQASDKDGKAINLSNGRVTVLHFWQYREKPLKDPYGQAAYVDFLYRNRDPEMVDVFGVNVDSRLNVQATRGASVRSARRFREFMNLSYPILHDDGALLRSLGDPRSVGAELPLYIVLDRNGKVFTYKSGFYEVDRREGLAELNAAIKAAALAR